MIAEQLAAPSAQRRHVGAIVEGDAFEVLDSCNHLGGDSMLLGRHSQQHLEKFNCGTAVGTRSRLVEPGQFGGIASKPALDSLQNVCAPSRTLEATRQRA